MLSPLRVLCLLCMLSQPQVRPEAAVHLVEPHEHAELALPVLPLQLLLAKAHYLLLADVNVYCLHAGSSVKGSVSMCPAAAQACRWVCSVACCQAGWPQAQLPDQLLLPILS